MSTINKQSANQSQKLMVFVLTMALYGLATLFTELIPKFQVGIVEFSVEYFLFIPLTLAMLFDPMSAALGAATGELVFSEIMLGQFGGLGELEKFIPSPLVSTLQAAWFPILRTESWLASRHLAVLRFSCCWERSWISSRCSLPLKTLSLWQVCPKAFSPPKASHS